MPYSANMLDFECRLLGQSSEGVMEHDTMFDEKVTATVASNLANNPADEACSARVEKFDSAEDSSLEYSTASTVIEDECKFADCVVSCERSIQQDDTVSDVTENEIERADCVVNDAGDELQDEPHQPCEVNALSFPDLNMVEIGSVSKSRHEKQSIIIDDTRASASRANSDENRVHFDNAADITCPLIQGVSDLVNETRVDTGHCFRTGSDDDAVEYANNDLSSTMNVDCNQNPQVNEDTYAASRFVSDDDAMEFNCCDEKSCSAVGEVSQEPTDMMCNAGSEQSIASKNEHSKLCETSHTDVPVVPFVSHRQDVIEVVNSADISLPINPNASQLLYSPTLHENKDKISLEKNGADERDLTRLCLESEIEGESLHYVSGKLPSSPPAMNACEDDEQENSELEEGELDDDDDDENADANFISAQTAIEKVESFAHHHQEFNSPKVPSTSSQACYDNTRSVSQVRDSKRKNTDDSSEETSRRKRSKIRHFNKEEDSEKASKTQIRRKQNSSDFDAMLRQELRRRTGAAGENESDEYSDEMDPYASPPPLLRIASCKDSENGEARAKLKLVRSLPASKTEALCVNFLEGNCNKGNECQYSHNVNHRVGSLPQMKMELCKFYQLGCCAKRQKCLYMHKDFPCRNYHTGMKCLSEDKCKFSHSHLSPVTKTILLKHLETAPKDILGDFPRLGKLGAEEVVEVTEMCRKRMTVNLDNIPGLWDWKGLGFKYVDRCIRAYEKIHNRRPKGSRRRDDDKHSTGRDARTRENENPNFIPIAPRNKCASEAGTSRKAPLLPTPSQPKDDGRNRTESDEECKSNDIMPNAKGHLREPTDGQRRLHVDDDEPGKRRDRRRHFGRPEDNDDAEYRSHHDPRHSRHHHRHSRHHHGTDRKDRHRDYSLPNDHRHRESDEGKSRGRESNTSRVGDRKHKRTRESESDEGNLEGRLLFDDASMDSSDRRFQYDRESFQDDVAGNNGNGSLEPQINFVGDQEAETVVKKHRNFEDVLPHPTRQQTVRDRINEMAEERPPGQSWYSSDEDDHNCSAGDSLMMDLPPENHEEAAEYNEEEHMSPSMRKNSHDSDSGTSDARRSKSSSPTRGVLRNFYDPMALFRQQQQKLLMEENTASKKEETNFDENQTSNNLELVRTVSKVEDNNTGHTPTPSTEEDSSSPVVNTNDNQSHLVTSSTAATTILSNLNLNKIEVPSDLAQVLSSIKNIKALLPQTSTSNSVTDTQPSPVLSALSQTSRDPRLRARQVSTEPPSNLETSCRESEDVGNSSGVSSRDPRIALKESRDPRQRRDILDRSTSLPTELKDEVQEIKSVLPVECRDPRLNRDPRLKKDTPFNNYIKNTENSELQRKYSSESESRDCDPTNELNFNGLINETSMRSLYASGEILRPPFQVPDHEPVNVINGSINAHPPIPYTLVEVIIPDVSYAYVKETLTKDDIRVKEDPRLYRMFYGLQERPSSPKDDVVYEDPESPPPASSIDVRDLKQNRDRRSVQDPRVPSLVHEICSNSLGFVSNIVTPMDSPMPGSDPHNPYLRNLDQRVGDSRIDPRTRSAPRPSSISDCRDPRAQRVFDNEVVVGGPSFGAGFMPHESGPAMIGVPMINVGGMDASYQSNGTILSAARTPIGLGPNGGLNNPYAMGFNMPHGGIVPPHMLGDPRMLAPMTGMNDNGLVPQNFAPLSRQSSFSGSNDPRSIRNSKSNDPRLRKIDNGASFSPSL